MDKELEFKILIKTKDMYNFLMGHMYSSFSGIFSILLSIGAIGLFFFGKKSEQSILLLVVAGLFLIGTPLQLLFKAKQQVTLNPMFKEPFTYTINSNGITVSQNEEKLETTWDSISRVVENRKTIVLYASRTSAYIMPKEQLGDKCNEFKKIISENVNINKGTHKK